MFYIRTDVNDQIGLGHLMRCLAIADALHDRGEETVFLLSDEEAVKLLTERGYRYVVLQTHWNKMEAELPALRQLIDEIHIDKLLIDSYQVTENYFKELSKEVTTIYIDDLGAAVYQTNAIICYANYWKRLHYDRYPQEVRRLVGLQYVPLRPVFWNCPQKKVEKQVKNLLLLSGGTDPCNALGQILRGLRRQKYEKIWVMCGRYNRNGRQLKLQYQQETNVMICTDVSEVEDYMAKADVAISAGGTTLYELCAFGVPTISYSFARNQWDNVRQFEEDGLIDYAGDMRERGTAEKIQRKLETYEMNEQMRMARAQKMQQMIDGMGALRLAELLIQI